MTTRTLLLVALASAALSVAAFGCHGTALSGERWYIDSPGVGVAYLPRTPAQVQAAAVLAIREDLGFRIRTESPLLVTAVTGNDQDVRVEITQVAEEQTKMEITMGVETPGMVIRQVMSHIEARLR